MGSHRLGWGSFVPEYPYRPFHVFGPVLYRGRRGHPLEGRQLASRRRALHEVYPRVPVGIPDLRRAFQAVCRPPVDNGPCRILCPGRASRSDPYPCLDHHHGRGPFGHRVWTSGVGLRGTGRDLRKQRTEKRICW